MQNKTKIILLGLLFSFSMVSNVFAYEADFMLEGLNTKVNIEQNLVRNENIQIGKLYSKTAPSASTVEIIRYELRGTTLKKVVGTYKREDRNDKIAYKLESTEIKDAEATTIIKNGNELICYNGNNSISYLTDQAMLELVRNKKNFLNTGDFVVKIGECNIPIVVKQTNKDNIYFTYKDNCYKCEYTNIYLTGISNVTDLYNDYALLLGKPSLIPNDDVSNSSREEGLYVYIMKQAADKDPDKYNKYADVFGVTVTFNGAQRVLNGVFSETTTIQKANDNIGTAQALLKRQGYTDDVISSAVDSYKSAINATSYVPSDNIVVSWTGQWYENADHTWSYSPNKKQSNVYTNTFALIESSTDKKFYLYKFNAEGKMEVNTEVANTINTFAEDGTGYLFNAQIKITPPLIKNAGGILNDYDSLCAQMIKQWRQTETVSNINKLSSEADNQKIIKEANDRASKVMTYDELNIYAIDGTAKVKWQEHEDGWSCAYQVGTGTSYATDGYYAVPDGAMWGNSRTGGYMYRVYYFKNKRMSTETNHGKETAWVFNTDGQLCDANSGKLIEAQTLAGLKSTMTKLVDELKASIINGANKVIQSNIPESTGGATSGGTSSIGGTSGTDIAGPGSSSGSATSEGGSSGGGSSGGSLAAYDPVGMSITATNPVSSEISNTVAGAGDSGFHNGKEGITSAVFHYDVYGYQTDTWGGDPTYVTFTPKTKIDMVFPKQYEIRNGNLLTNSHYVPTRKEVEAVIANFYKNAPTGAANMTDKTFSALNREANEGINPDLPQELRRLFGGDYYDIDVATSTAQILATTLDCINYNGNIDWNTEAINGYMNSSTLEGSELLKPEVINMLILKAFGEYQYYSCYKLYTDNDPGIVELFVSRSILDQYWDFKDSIKNYAKVGAKDKYTFDDIIKYIYYLDKRYAGLRNTQKVEIKNLSGMSDKDTQKAAEYLIQEGFYTENEILERTGRDFTKKDLETAAIKIYNVINKGQNINTRVE